MKNTTTSALPIQIPTVKDTEVINKRKGFTAFVLNIIIIILEIIGTKISLSDGMDSLLYYTVLSNIFCFSTCVLYSLSYIKTHGKIPAVIITLRYTATVCLTLTFSVVLFLFVPMTSLEILYQGPQLYHHLLCPIISFISFMCFETRKPLSIIQTLFAIVPTVLYSVIITDLNIVKTIEGPYPFLKVYEQEWYWSAIYFVIILLLSCIIASMIRKLTEITKES